MRFSFSAQDSMLVVRAHQVSHRPCKCHTMYHKCIILYNDRDWLGHPVFKVQKPRYFVVSVEDCEKVCAFSNTVIAGRVKVALVRLALSVCLVFISNEKSCGSKAKGG